MSAEPHVTPLHPRFGVEVHGIDLRLVTADHGYPAVRAWFEEHSLLLFRDQELDDRAQLAFASLFGPIEDRSAEPGPEPPVSPVSNLLADGTVAADGSMHTLDLTGNQLWHTDSTFLPVPALANVLAARVLPSGGGETEVASTRAAWDDAPAALRDRAAGAVVRHRLSHSRSKVDAGLAALPHITRWPEQAWRAHWPNPVNGRHAFYIASHAYAVDTMAPDEGAALIDEIIERCTSPELVYTHRWQPGDVLVWDERATLHRGRPWPYDEERTLVSVCVSVRDVDGLPAVRPISRS